MRRRIFIKYKRLEESNLKFIKIKEWKYIKRYRLKKLKKHSKTLKFKKEHNKVYKENIYKPFIDKLQYWGLSFDLITSSFFP